MNHTPSWITDVERLALGKPVLLVEGAGDWLQKFRDAPIQPPDDLKELLDWILNLVP